MSIRGQSFVLVLVAFLQASGQAAEPEIAAQRFGDVTESRVLKERTGENWLVNGGRFTGLHFSPLAQIDRDNVKQLGLAWATDLPSPLGLTAEPLVVDGVLYLSGSLSRVFALDAATGSLLWKFDPQVRMDLSFANSLFARWNRGVAVWEGAVYVGTSDCRVVAIDAARGAKLWEARICDPRQGSGAGITGAPRVGAGKVFMGYAATSGTTSASGFKPRGSIVALDAKNGAELWRFWTVPGDPAEGFESEQLEQASETWTGGFAKGGGGTVWEGIRYDPETGFVIFGTASTMPLNVALRGPGDNLFTNSIVAVDAETGAYRWHYQTVPSDAWAYDSASPLVIANLELDGKARRVVMEAPKNGFLYLLDARSGELLAADPIARVNWASHVDLETGRPVEVPGARYYEKDHPDRAVVLYPNMAGAHNWHAMSYSPLTRLLYIPILDMPTTISAGTRGAGARADYGTDEDLPPGVGKLVAWDPEKRERRWAVDYTLPVNGGVLSTAGGLVFQGTARGEFRAHAADSGAQLWAHKTGSAIQAAPVSYRVGDVQYVAVAAGLGGGFATGLPTRSSSPDARGPARLLAYKIGGTQELPPAAPLQVTVPKPPPRTASAAQIERGAILFGEVHCGTCHGVGTIGIGERRLGGALPDLRYMPEHVHEEWQGIVLGGNRSRQGMPSFREKLSAEDSEAIHAYVIEQAWKVYESSRARPAR